MMNRNIYVRGRGLVEVMFRHLLEWAEEDHESGCPSRYSNLTLPRSLSHLLGSCSLHFHDRIVLYIYGSTARITKTVKLHCLLLILYVRHLLRVTVNKIHV
jgi:hypothetical protein